MGIIIDRDFLSYEIQYDSITKRFEAWKDGEQVGSEKTQAELEAYLKKLKKATFKRFTVIRSSGGREVCIGVVTSFVKTHGYGRDHIEVWFTWKDEDNEPQRRKLPLHSLYETTEKRLKIAMQMMATSKELGKLYEKFEALRNKLGIHITYNDLLRLGGLEKPLK